jgi:hypothetical protein
MMSSALTGRVNISLAAYPGLAFHEAMERVCSEAPEEPVLGALQVNDTQLCPQNRGVLTPEYADVLLNLYPNTRFRLHANVRVLPSRQILDWSSYGQAKEYWNTLAGISKQLNANAYTAHAGRRSEASLAEIIESARRAEDLFDCPVGIEGHYPTPNDVFLVSTWDEYRTLFESGVNYAVDLSHLNIVAEQSGHRESTLVQEMLACECCIEVHVSSNDGTKDQHRTLDRQPWWWALTKHINPAAVIFSEGVQ